MTQEDVKKFANAGTTDVILNVIKDEEFIEKKDEYVFYLCAYIKELSGIVIQVDSWNEDELIKKAQALYTMFARYQKEDHNIVLPAKLNFTIHYKFTFEEWMQE
jgi:hypothetical protein